MIAFRKAHAALRPLNFYSSVQLTWWTPAGTTPDVTCFNNGSNHAIAYQFNGGALGDSSGTNWYRVTDSCGWAEGPNQVRTPGAEDSIGGQGFVYGLCGRGLLLLIAK
jgi:isoamylase